MSKFAVIAMLFLALTAAGVGPSWGHDGGREPDESHGSERATEHEDRGRASEAPGSRAGEDRGNRSAEAPGNRSGEDRSGGADKRRGAGTEDRP